MRNLRPLLVFGALAMPFAGNSQYNRAASPSPSNKTISYKLERNEPAQSGLFGLVVNPVYVDGSKLNLNIGGGLELFYTFKSHLRISGGYHYAYLDNLTGGDQNRGSGGDLDSYGTAVKNKKSSRFGILVSPTILSWEKEENYHITLGSAGYRTVAVTRVRGNVVRALTGRLGYLVDNRVIQSKNGLPFKTTTPEYVYHYENNDYTLTPTWLSTSSTMMQSNIAVIGIGYTSFRDIKITLDDEKYTGRREEKAQSDLFIDLLFAHKLSLQDMVYYHPLYNLTQEYDHLPQRLDLSATALNKMGFRLGYQVISMFRPNFGAKVVLEGGVRPGLKGGEQKNSNLYAQLTYGIIFGGRMAHE